MTQPHPGAHPGARPELREVQLQAIVEGIDGFYRDGTLDYAQLEESFLRMGDEDLRSVQAYSVHADVRAIAGRVLDERGSEQAPQRPITGTVGQVLTPEVVF